MGLIVWNRVLCLFFAVFISSLLIFAAFSKIISPSSSASPIDLFASFVEICMAAMLLIYFPFGRVWSLAGLMFASWGGYALFWAVRGQPCSCLGTVIAFPPGLLLPLNLFLFAGAALIAYKSAPGRIFRYFCGISAIVFIVGIVSGYLVSNYFIEK